MPALNWNVFATLPGAATNNFELLCRGIIRRHYGQYGDFRALSNQPGVEFHLKLHTACNLGAADRWYGWQCRWYDLPSGIDIGAARRGHIKDAIERSEKVLPGLTDWVLWTRYTLTKNDQTWLFGLKTKLRLALWAAEEVEEHLSGPAAILRETYFGELVLTPDALKELHEKTVEPIRRRWRPEVHQVIDAERVLHRALGEIKAWSNLDDLKSQLDEDITAVGGSVSALPDPLRGQVTALIERAKNARSILDQCYASLKDGRYESLFQLAGAVIAPTPQEERLAPQLRARRLVAALHVNNMLADMVRGQKAIRSLRRAIGRRFIPIIAEAGCGKTELAAQLTAPNDHRSAGLLLRAKFLAAGQTLDEFAKRVSVRGKPVSTFESLIAAVDAAGQREATRLPIVIDGLNEAEDPRDWKDQLASLPVMLAQYDNVQIICTLRSAFVAEALPDDSECLEIQGFENDLGEAVRRYFTYYKIDALDAELPWELLNHPLTLRIFCDVTNGDRRQTVDVTAIPGSLSVLFERYLQQAASRIAELSPSACRFFPADVEVALRKIGSALWAGRCREIEIDQLRKLLSDDTRSWDHSLVAALENDGVLFREPSEAPGPGNMSIVFDALTGHVVADALLAEYPGDSFDKWLGDAKTLALLRTGIGEQSALLTAVQRFASSLPPRLAEIANSALRRVRRSPRHDHHPVANDIFRALVGLTPRRMNQKQLWRLLTGEMRTDALVEAAFLDHAHLDQETVLQLAPLVREPNPRRRDLVFRLFSTRAAPAHPLNSDFLDSVLRPMPMADRDLRWSEWLRRDESAISRDAERLAKRWKSGIFKERADGLRARWLMWTLTSTARVRRDYSTLALYWFGCRDPETLFSLALDSLAINDPYVPERMLAACYGIAMSLWADPRGKKVQEALPSFARRLVDEMFIQDAPHSTPHILTRDYALGVIALAQKLEPNCISEANRGHLVPPFKFKSPFPPANTITDVDVADAKSAMHMDFENYTLGRLIRGRSNYDFKHEEYTNVRRQIEYRIVKLGYSIKRFDKIDRMIAESGWRVESRGGIKTDRYGKKYSWIAYFEMYGVRLDAGEIDERYDRERPSDADIDPSFPEVAKLFDPALLPDPFRGTPTEPRKWLSEGPTPNYEPLLQCDVIDGKPGPWLALEGFVQQSSHDDDRMLFTFFRGILVKRERTTELIAGFNALEYPGNRAIPEASKDYYTYAGEIPWSKHFAAHLRDEKGRAKPDEQAAFAVHDGKRWLPGIPVEIPACDFNWESYHSALNQTSGIVFLAPALCERFDLRNHQGEWDLYEQSGRPATAYRESKDEKDNFRSRLLYLRADLMANYLSPELDLVWFVWGERGFHYKSISSDLREAFSGHTHIHRFSKVWRPTTS
jgi:hypothetical protein